MFVYATAPPYLLTCVLLFLLPLVLPPHDTSKTFGPSELLFFRIDYSASLALNHMLQFI